MEIVIIVAVAFLLDLIFGDPYWLPHPIRLIGLLISRCETILGRIFPESKRGALIAGIFLNLIVVATSFAVPFFLLNQYPNHLVISAPLHTLYHQNITM